jgi:hypothetical protein
MVNRVTLTGLNTKLTALAQVKPTIMRDAYTYFHSITPIRSGNARNRTRLVRNRIEAVYPYAKRLDTGWSKQFGGLGMSNPTLKYIRTLVANFIKKLGR